VLAFNQHNILSQAILILKQDNDAHTHDLLLLMVSLSPLLCVQDQLTTSELCLDWETLQDKLRERPALFTSVVWPALAVVGWQRAASNTAAAAAEEPTAAGTSDASVPPAAVLEEQQQQPDINAAVASSSAVHAPSSALFYLAPACVSAAYLASVGEPLQPCSSWEDVLEALRESGQAVPAVCIAGLRAAELAEAVSACLEPPRADAPHRCVHDPSAKRPGTPLTSRKFVSDVAQFQDS
jgi:hypothetical protein